MTQELGDDNIKNFDGISDTIAHERNLNDRSEDQKANKEDPIKAHSPQPNARRAQFSDNRGVVSETKPELQHLQMIASSASLSLEIAENGSK